MCIIRSCSKGTTPITENPCVLLGLLWLTECTETSSRLRLLLVLWRLVECPKCSSIGICVSIIGLAECAKSIGWCGIGIAERTKACCWRRRCRSVLLSKDSTGRLSWLSRCIKSCLAKCTCGFTPLLIILQSKLLKKALEKKDGYRRMTHLERASSICRHTCDTLVLEGHRGIRRILLSINTERRVSSTCSYWRHRIARYGCGFRELLNIRKYIKARKLTKWRTKAGRLVSIEQVIVALANKRAATG